ncbi:uncharacterized protein GGS22DRAFT_196757 [Annulohypoxylon maeteangense]|uniref:uncharacterized protein n=1 Tax=Annulohypoxylon maeteangense TaxID=1927788 RepID=UPI002007709C|nr:uncharacterized protein GGS22DRAFT_196757 [Annulohypoxylon maeteangense]KAI0889062.1 hypothetical protein GGS22DRAFT_196757 [Annulohypoxylon maeteangense]
MDPKKSFATTEPASVDDALFDLDPPVGRRVEDPQASSSIHPRRRSQSSLRSEFNPQTPSPCATREAPGEDCALQRFIVWAAVKRNKSTRMVPNDRLRCPLVLCGERFDDHEKMLRHLTKCQHLKTGEYLCYDCMKVERFNDEKCRCCLGHPTKRKRIMNLARNFFSNIGNRSRRSLSPSNFQEDVSMPPPSYDSLVIDLDEISQQQQQQQQEQDRQQPQPQPQLELNGNEIHELDSMQMLPTAQLDSVNYDTDTPMTSDQHDATVGTVAPQQLNTFSQHAWPVTQNANKDESIPPINLTPTNSGSRRPSLALNTHIDHCRRAPRSKYLSPSSSLRSTGSSQMISPITPWSASSGDSGAWTMCSGIDTAMTSPITPLSSDCPPFDILPSSKAPDKMPVDDCDYMIGNMSELPGDDSLPIPRGLSDPLFFSFDPKDNYSWMPSVNTEISLATSVNMMFTDTNSKSANVSSRLAEPTSHGPDTRMLVQSSWEALEEHVSSSISKLSHIEGNPLVERLRMQSPKAIALSGLSSLRNVLQGSNLTDPLDYICFVHLIYAFSLVIHENELAARCDMLYRQALSYRRFIDPSQVEYYTQIATIIWQPTSNNESSTQRISLRGSSSGKGKEREHRTGPRINIDTDPLVAVGQNFLDDIEHSVISSSSERPIEVNASELWSTHLVDFQPDSSHESPFTITVDYIIQCLDLKFSNSKTLLPRLTEIGRRVRAGHITTIRKLELAILQAGKKSLESSETFDEFIPQVRGLCNPIYAEQGYSTRARYQVLAVSLVETLIQSVSSDSQHTQESGSFPFNEFLENLHVTFDDPSSDDFLVPLSTSASSQADLSTTRSFNSAVDPLDLQGINPNARQPTTTSASFPSTASHPGTPESSFAASLPIILGAPPKSSTSGRAGASPKLISSSMQKIEANDCCEICGYRPKGDPQWFKGSMAKHKKMQHATGPPIIYKCPYPGCNSQYKNRQDNLRQHQIEKKHWVGDEASRRPSKRARTSPS